ncbi:hypothetical protein [Acidimicrobium ferrooxidans]|nr:hypothetical protein [Acidimicrobium ferrooxidans]
MAGVLAVVPGARGSGTKTLTGSQVSWSIAWVPASVPSVALPSVSFASFEDPTNPTEGPQPTFPHPNIATPEGAALSVGQPIIVAPQTSELGTTLSGSATVAGGIVVTVTVNGVAEPPVTVSNVASYAMSWQASVEDVYVSAGTVPASAPILAGTNVLAPTANDVTPTGSLAPGTFGSLCDAGAVSASSDLFSRLTPALAQSAAGKLSPLVSTPTSEDPGTCAIEFAAPSGLSGGSTWTVNAQLAAAFTATATARLQTVHLSVDGVAVTIPGGTYSDVTLDVPPWVLGPATSIDEQVATVESLPVGAAVFGG